MADQEIKIHCAHTRMVPLSELKAHPRNRNKHPPEQIERLAKIIQYQGIRHPIKVSTLSGFITAGHGRLAAAKLLGLSSFPVDFQDYENEEQEWADVQSDNAIALWAELDLAGINADLPDFGPDFDLDMLGIKDFTLNIVDRLDPKYDKVGSKELDANDFNDFDHKCPRCGFEYDQAP